MELVFSEVIHQIWRLVGPRKTDYLSAFSTHKQSLQVLAVVETGYSIAVDINHDRIEKTVVKIDTTFCWEDNDLKEGIIKDWVNIYIIKQLKSQIYSHTLQLFFFVDLAYKRFRVEGQNFFIVFHRVIDE